MPIVKVEKTEDEKKEVYSPSLPTRLRTVGQGLLLGGADEAEALIRSGFGLLGDDADYARILADVRGDIDEYRTERPVEALGYELMGATPLALISIPAGPAGPATVYGSTLARTGPAMARALTSGRASAPVKAGVIEGSAYGFLSAEEGERLGGAVTGGVTGGIAGPVVGKTTELTGRGLRAAGEKIYGATKGELQSIGATMQNIKNFFTREDTPPLPTGDIQKELARIIAKSGMSVDQFMSRLKDGYSPADASPSVRQYLRAMRTELSDEQIEEMVARPAKAREKAMDVVREGLTGQKEGDILKQVTQSLEDLRVQEGAAYQPIFREQADAIPTSAINDIEDIINRAPDSLDEINKLMRARGLEKFYKVTNGKIQVTRKPTLEELEAVRRALGESADNQIPSVRAEYKAGETKLRDILDTASPDLKQTRQNYAKIMSAKDAFEEGRKIFNKNFADADMIFDKILSQGDESVAAFRAGAAQQAQDVAGSARVKSFFRNIADEEKDIFKTFNRIFPKDKYDEAADALDLARRKEATTEKILKGADTAESVSIATAETEGGVRGLLGLAIRDGENRGGALKRVTEIILGPKFTNEQKVKILETLLSENPTVLKDAMSTAAGLQAFERKLQGTAMRFKGAGVSGSASVSGEAQRQADRLFNRDEE